MLKSKAPRSGAFFFGSWVPKSWKKGWNKAAKNSFNGYTAGLRQSLIGIHMRKPHKPAWKVYTSGGGVYIDYFGERNLNTIFLTDPLTGLKPYFTVSFMLL